MRQAPLLFVSRPITLEFFGMSGCAMLVRLSTRQSDDKFHNQKTVQNGPHTRLHYAPKRQTRLSIISIHWSSDYSTCWVNCKTMSCFQMEHQKALMSRFRGSISAPCCAVTLAAGH